ncbi:zinc finger domain-containing protein [Streptomyces mirabilis]|uniref:zinc finger domain-containing protein n=1 Tax=Streptomyces mirabilis TaxID=68239 RepID=UPI0033B06165
MSRARPDGDRPTVEQIRHLIGHAEYRPLNPAEAARLHAGVEHLIASQAEHATRLTRLLAAGSRPALDVFCPACQAPARAPCVNRFGQPASAPHSLRLASAALPADDRNTP